MLAQIKSTHVVLIAQLLGQVRAHQLPPLQRVAPQGSLALLARGAADGLLVLHLEIYKISQTVRRAGGAQACFKGDKFWVQSFE